jgi:carboxylesterase type B
VQALYPVTSDSQAHQAYVDMFTDYSSVCPARDLANLTTAHGTKDVFIYSYAVGRAYHGDELLALFQEETSFPGGTTPSAGFQSLMQGYWTQFAASGTPNGASDGGAPVWPTYEGADQPYLTLSDPTPTAGTMLRSAQCDFWDAQNYVFGP